MATPVQAQAQEQEQELEPAQAPGLVQVQARVMLSRALLRWWGLS